MEEAQVDGGGEAGDVVGEQATTTAGSDESVQGEASTFQGREMTTMLPTSPNWYCGQVADCSLDGVYAYGAKADVQLLHIKSRKFVGALRGHEDRITSLEIDKRSGSRGGLHCVSGAADATVRVWDMRTLQCLAQHRLHKVR
jgi:WD40 repeat protein